MKITGNQSINASPDIIWSKILDPRVMEKITPGIEELEIISEDHYTAISKIKIGPVKGAFKGELTIKDKVENESCVVVLDQKSKIGNAVAEIAMKLVVLDNGETEVQYEGTAKMSGMLATMGQRIIGGVISTLSKQFFKALEKEIESD